MEQEKITKQMIEFHKATFDNTFNAMTILQEQTEKMVNMFLEQAPWFPAEGKEAVNEWLKTYKKGREAFKASVNESYKKVEEFFGNIEKTAAKTKAGK
jgi:polyhydroxyalkanoate synthesis regulator phasin